MMGFTRMLQGICYMSDRAYGKSGSLPAWYMTLRGYLSTIAGLSLLATTVFFLAQDWVCGQSTTGVWIITGEVEM